MPANITLKMNGNINATKVTNAEWARILAFYQGVYSTRDAQGNLVVPTEAQTVTAIYNAFVAGIMQNVARGEKDIAAASAQAAVATITPTSDTPA